MSRSHLIALSLLAFGCGASSYEDDAPMSSRSAAMSQGTTSEGYATGGSSVAFGGQRAANAPMEEDLDGLYEGEVKAKSAVSDSSVLARDGEDGADSPDRATAPKLIRTGSVSVAVENYEPFERQLKSWLGEQGGYISDTNLSHSDGEVSYATLTIRVPAEQFETLVSWTEERVRVESVNVNTQDVTAQWVDVQARLDNDRRAEARLQELLANRTARLSDVLEVERELARVRGEIESAEGQLRLLKDRVGYATLHLDVRVATPYVAGQAPTFLQEASRSFTGSLALMADVGRAGALLMVALSPWLGPPAFLLALLVLVLRGRSRRRRSLAT